MKSLLDGDLLEQVTIKDLFARVYRNYGVVLGIWPERLWSGGDSFYDAWVIDFVNDADRVEMNGKPATVVPFLPMDTYQLELFIKGLFLQWEVDLDSWMRLF